jgi:predicted HTH domain antitoxin
MPLMLEIPDAAADAMRLPRQEVEAELRKELALVLYSRGVFSAGKAAEFSGLARLAFEQLLCDRQIERPFSLEELDRDLAWAEKRAANPEF